MLYSNWEKHALLENLNFIYQGPRLSILSKEAKSGATKSYKIVHIPNCVRCPYYLAKKMNPKHLGFFKMHFFFENTVEIFENCSQCSPISQVSANPSFFLSDLKWSPFFSQYEISSKFWNFRPPCSQHELNFFWINKSEAQGKKITVR